MKTGPELLDELKTKPIAVASQVLEWEGVVYASQYAQACLREPIWRCGHRHDSPHDATDCAVQRLESGPPK